MIICLLYRRCHENNLCIIIISEKMTFLSDKRQKFIQHLLLSFALVLIIYVDLLFYTHAHINDYCRFLVSLFSYACYRKSKKKNSLVSLISPKILKKERKTPWNSVWLSGTTITRRRLLLPFSLSLKSSYTKDDDASKKSVFARLVDEKWVACKNVDHDHFLGTNRWLACRPSFFLIGS